MNINSEPKWAFGLGLMAILLPAAGIFAEEPNYEAVEAKLRELAPNATTIAISDAPVDGLLQAQINNDILYVSPDGTYLLQGNLYELETRINLTDQAKAVIRREAIRGLDESEMITFSPEHPDHRLMVFTDIDCGYCRKLHEQIQDYMAQGIAISYLAFPRAGIGSHSYEKYVSVWCADNQQEALTMAKAGTEPEPLQCDNPVTSQYELGRAVGVTGTPALMTHDGTLIPGYMPPAQLKERLDAIDSLAQASP